MKKLILIFIFSIALLSCERDNKYPDNPDWLDAKISQMETLPYYAGTTVYAYKWDREYYYLISIPLSSCMMCEFYNYQGEKINWSEDKIADFQKNSKRLNIVWERGFNK